MNKFVFGKAAISILESTERANSSTISYPVFSEEEVVSEALNFHVKALMTKENPETIIKNHIKGHPHIREMSARDLIDLWVENFSYTSEFLIYSEHITTDFYRKYFPKPIKIKSTLKPTLVEFLKLDNNDVENMVMCEQISTMNMSEVRKMKAWNFDLYLDFFKNVMLPKYKLKVFLNGTYLSYRKDTFILPEQFKEHNVLTP